MVQVVDHQALSAHRKVRCKKGPQVSAHKEPVVQRCFDQAVTLGLCQLGHGQERAPLLYALVARLHLKVIKQD